jgi:hypothetical protein
MRRPRHRARRRPSPLRLRSGQALAGQSRRLSPRARCLRDRVSWPRRSVCAISQQEKVARAGKPPLATDCCSSNYLIQTALTVPCRDDARSAVSERSGSDAERSGVAAPERDAMRAAAERFRAAELVATHAAAVHSRAAAPERDAMHAAEPAEPSSTLQVWAHSNCAHSPSSLRWQAD